MDKLHVSGIENDSIVDGEGLRIAIFVQGCPHNCKGCHNPETHSFDESAGSFYSLEYIMDTIKNNPLIDGVTFSGGEPFCQAKVLAKLAKMIHEYNPDLHILSYTGYTYEWLLENGNESNGYLELLDSIDAIIDGPYIEDLRSLELHFMGSSNQRYIDLSFIEKK